MDALKSQYDHADDTVSPLTHVDIKTHNPKHMEQIMMSKLVYLERELHRARNRIQQLETGMGLINQRLNRD